jgi:probable phosphoglycerate mutase
LSIEVVLIRHGESVANAGAATDNPATIPLTAKGHAQARSAATQFQCEPSLIVCSPFLRTQQTAQPTIERFPQVPVEQWPVYEFTYLEPTRYACTNAAERRPAVQAYWRKGDPHYRDGSSAESFADLLSRIADVLARLECQPDGSRVLLFTHGQWMQALRLHLLLPAASDAEKMAQFVQFDRTYPIAHTETVRLVFTMSGWELS